LVPGYDGFESLEVIRREQDTTLVPVVSGQDPEALPPLVGNDPMDMTHGTPREAMSDIPVTALVPRPVDPNRLTVTVAEVFAEVEASVFGQSEAQRTRSTRDSKNFLPNRLARANPDNLVSDDTDDDAIG